MADGATRCRLMIRVVHCVMDSIMKTVRFLCIGSSDIFHADPRILLNAVYFSFFGIFIQLLLQISRGLLAALNA